MCRPVACKHCSKITWAGCGLHVDQLRSRIPADQWCEGHRSAGAPANGLIRRLFGRNPR